jgi:hypothetical protein
MLDVLSVSMQQARITPQTIQHLVLARIEVLQLRDFEVVLGVWFCAFRNANTDSATCSRSSRFLQASATCGVGFLAEFSSEKSRRLFLCNVVADQQATTERHFVETEPVGVQDASRLDG